jgi:hypothetical protein
LKLACLKEQGQIKLHAMKTNLKLFKLSFLVSLTFFFSALEAFAGDAFIDRDGRTFTVSIDGINTTRIPARDIKDSESVVPYTIQWSVNVEQGPRCFRITPTDTRLGEPERIDVLIHEIQTDKPYNSWRNYTAVPSTLENTTTFLKGDGFCVSEYTLTDRLRFPSLPAGQYIAMISFWGKGNWDRQTILLTVAKSSAQVSEPPAAQPAVSEITDPAECTITYAAQRTMALHQQLEDKVAAGAADQDVFRSFGKDTEEFGALYSSNLPEVCSRLQTIKNKYQLK